MKKSKVLLVIFLAWFVFFLSKQTLDMMIIIPLLFATAVSFFMVCLYKERGPIVILIMVAFFLLLIASLIVIKAYNPIWEVSEWRPNMFGLLGVIFLWLGEKVWLSQRNKKGLPDKRFRSYFITNVSANNIAREMLAETFFAFSLFFLIIFGSYYLVTGQTEVSFDSAFFGVVLFLAYLVLVGISRAMLGVPKTKIVGWIFFIFFRLLSMAVIIPFLEIVQSFYGC